MVTATIGVVANGTETQNIRSVTEGLSRRLVSAEARVSPLLKVELFRHLQLVAQKVAARNSGGYPGGTTSNSLSKRSGVAMDSLRRGVRVSAGAGGLEGTMSGVHYLTIHEYGGTIRARNAQYLTIPLNEALNANGVPKKMSAREWNNTFVSQSKKGNLIIFQRRGRLIVPLYVLKKSVKIRARLGLRKEQQDAIDLFVNRATKMFEQVLLK